MTKYNEALTAEVNNLIASRPGLRLELQRLMLSHTIEERGNLIRYWFFDTVWPGWSSGLWHSLGWMVAEEVDWEEVARRVQAE